MARVQSPAVAFLAYEHAGRGGKPLLLLHGWPETRRIWKRNVEPLAPDDRYDVAAHATDVAALVHALGHERIVACGGDLGGVVAQDLSLRFEGLVERLVLFAFLGGARIVLARRRRPHDGALRRRRAIPRSIGRAAPGTRTARLTEPNPIPTLILYGPEDHVIPPDFPARMEAAFPNRAGPFVVQGPATSSNGSAPTC